MVVILILPSSSTSTTNTTTSINNDCDQYSNQPSNNNKNRYNRSNATNSYEQQTHKNKKTNKTKNYVRHITRVNISDVYSQVEVDGDEPVTKEEEVVTKKTTELTTKKQIETRVKRQIVLEDGKVVQDSGPMVETNTTEDTDTKESESVERRKVGADEVDGPKAIDHFPSDVNDQQALVDFSNDDSKALSPRPDGLVRETKTKKVVTREEVNERTETEDVKHLGDISDEAYVKAVNSGVENIEDVLLSPEVQKQLIPTGPRLIHHSTKARKTIDTENTDLKCLAKPDGTLVTEKKQTTEHEELIDDELPEADDNSTGSRERIDHTQSSQKFSKQRDEQEVEYVADGKVIGKEMRYATENEEVERDGPPEDASDWDSLSDRVRKARMKQKTLLQQHRDALMNERKGALTKRPIDFEKEEETRKDETMKWLESHFGSESRSSRDSQDDDDTKKKTSYFNVTIKSDAKVSPSPIDPGYSKSNCTPNLKTPSKIVLPEREAPKQSKYFQGISEWSERKESAPRNFSTKTFQDELKGTLERNKLRHVASREELRPARYKEDVVKSDDEARKKNIRNEIRYGSRNDLRYRRDSRGGSDDSRNLRSQREDLGYMSGSRTDIRPRHGSRDDLYSKSRKNTNYLHREDSGYVKDSREDIRYGKTIPTREDSFIRDSGEEEKQYKNSSKYIDSAIQRDDSAYVSSSTFFTEPRLPKTIPLRTPDSGIRSPSPEAYDSEATRPTVPQRKRLIEKKTRAIQKDLQKEDEPPPDYSPPSRSRSISPMPSPNSHVNGCPRKLYQKTRFASSSELSRPMSTQTIQTQTSPQKKKGLSIGNSIRKLVGKIRSASADRKTKQKTKHSSSPNSKHQQQSYDTNGGSTYQQYNVIDSHIGQQSQQQTIPHHAPLSNRESSVVSSGRRERTLDRRGSSDVDSMAIPKQKYYLGEDPYLSIYGKENKYDGVKQAHYQQRYPGRRQRSDDVDIYNPTRLVQPSTATTLGRFSKSTNRLETIPTSPDYDYRSAQTLPGKLKHKPMHSSAINIAIVNNNSRPATTATTATTAHFNGPTKPARSYNVLNRSKSFNVHGLNGTNNPSPIYIEKLGRDVSQRALYRSNPHLTEEKPQLRSPSIVNLISRSQRDLTKIDEHDGYTNGYSHERNNEYSNRNGHSPLYNPNGERRANSLLRTTQDRYPVDYDSPSRTIQNFRERNLQRERESSLGSRSPVTINKDTASIVRRGSSSTDDYSESYRTTTKSNDPYRPGITNTVHNFSKKTTPTRGGVETVESSERKSVTTSRYNSEPPSNIRYTQERIRKGATPVVIHVRNNSRK